ncbi:MAG: tetratricopeptide repeat protein [Myxococcales bacterium]|jgi:tetratricopeptide (TPR) repeat protein|nr:tetratricopeptide repeat protein [Myxococcales bacterium]
MLNVFNKSKIVFGMLLVLLLVGCGGAKTKKTTTGKLQTDADGNVLLTKEARDDFQKATQMIADGDKSGWTADNCDAAIKEFERFEKKYGVAEAAYNIGAVQAKCGKTAEAKSTFERVLKSYPERLPVKQLVLAHQAAMAIEEGKEAEAQKLLQETVGLGPNTVEAVPAYTMAATLLLEKAKEGDQAAWGKSQTNLRTALAIDAKYMPALYQLAMLYFEIAVTLNRPSYLTLASLVFDQAVKTDPEFAPIYHALGRILLHKNELVEALKAFERAFEKDPTLFEAYMSYAAINLNFRGYEAAKAAFEKAIALRPNSYDAHMGLGVAARGLGDYALARAQYKKTSELDKNRTDYIYNLGLLEMDYENTGTPEGFEKAAQVFEMFLKNATKEHAIDPDGPKGPELSYVDKAKRRIATARKAIEDIKQAEREMAELKKMAAEQEKAAKELEAQQKRAAELAEKEASGAAGPASGEAVDEAAVEAEVAAMEAAEAKKAAEAKAAEEAAKKAAEEAAAQEKAAKDEASKAKGSVKLD